LEFAALRFCVSRLVSRDNLKQRLTRRKDTQSQTKTLPICDLA
jgi:hypothetical protein